MLSDDPLWYKDAIIYQVHVKAFFDSNDDGIGDFRGLVEKLDYIQDLGVTALWFLPFYPSPLRDDGTTSPTIGASIRPTGPCATFATWCARPIAVRPVHRHEDAAAPLPENGRASCWYSGCPPWASSVVA